MICSNKSSLDITVYVRNNLNNSIEYLIEEEGINCLSNQTYTCEEVEEVDHRCVYHMWQFWTFIVLMSIGTIAFNVVNSVSDAICFDVIGTLQIKNFKHKLF